MSSNEHTGARLVTKPVTKAYSEKYDGIFQERPLRRMVFEKDKEATEYIAEQGAKFTNYEFIIQFEFGNVAVYSRKIK